MKPFTVNVADEILEDLRVRLARTRWPDQVEQAGWDSGTDLSCLRELVHYWLTTFDWREQERRFTKDELLTNVTLYWVTETINASTRRYYEVRRNPNPLKLGERIETPTGIAMFPGEKDLVVPREWAERCYNIARWTDMPSGGFTNHFARGRFDAGLR